MKNEQTKETSYHTGQPERNRRHDDSSGDYRRGRIFLSDSKPDFDQQYIRTGDYHCTLRTVTCVDRHDDIECSIIADRLCNMRKGIWGEDGIYEHPAAIISGGIRACISEFRIADRQ